MCEALIIHVCRNVSETGLDFAVATDHEDILRCVEKAGYKAVMTAVSHSSGTERVAEAYRLLGIQADIVVNVQGDEPFVRPEEIMNVAGASRSIRRLALRHLPQNSIRLTVSDCLKIRIL